MSEGHERGDAVHRIRKLAYAGIALGTVIYLVGVVVGYATSVEVATADICNRKLYSVDAKKDCAIAEHPPDEDLTFYEDSLPKWIEVRTQLALDYRRSLQRECKLGLLVAAVNDTTAYVETRKNLEDETARIAELTKRESGLRVGYGLPYRLGSMIVNVIVTLLAAWLLTHTARGVVITNKEGQLDRILGAWKRSFGWFAAGGVAVVIFVMFAGGIYVHDKIWVGTDSWVVSPVANIFTVVSVSGAVVTFATPMSLLWALGDREYVPETVRPTQPDGQCGVGRYVTFLQTWTMIAFAFTIVPSIGYLRWTTTGKEPGPPAYVVPVFLGLGLTGWLIGRLVRNAIVLRARYRASLRKLGKTWQSVDAQKPAPDPTIPFIGEDWWKLPATLAGVLLTFWKVLDWTGVGDTLAALLK